MVQGLHITEGIHVNGDVGKWGGGGGTVGRGSLPLEKNTRNRWTDKNTKKPLDSDSLSTVSTHDRGLNIKTGKEKGNKRILFVVTQLLWGR